MMLVHWTSMKLIYGYIQVAGMTFLLFKQTFCSNESEHPAISSLIVEGRDCNVLRSAADGNERAKM